MAIFCSINDNFNPDVPYCNIIGPTGGFANYVGWLIFLDQKFRLINVVDDLDAIKFKKTDWPDYIKDLANIFPNIKNMLSKDISQVIKTNLDVKDIDSKLYFLENYIFPPSRSWNNWFVYEWSYRIPLQSIINVENDINKCNISKNQNLLLTIDPTLAYKCYVKFNSFLNNQSKEEFLRDTQFTNEFHNSIIADNILTLGSDVLFQNSLDFEWYLKLITWFDLEDNYPHACLLHNLWYNAHKRAEQDIVQTFTSLYNI